MPAAVIDLDTYKCERVAREVGPLHFLSLSDVRARLELDQAIDAVLSEPDAEDLELETIPPPAIDDGRFRVAPVSKRVWRVRC